MAQHSFRIGIHTGKSSKASTAWKAAIPPPCATAQPRLLATETSSVSSGKYTTWANQYDGLDQFFWNGQTRMCSHARWRGMDETVGLGHGAGKVPSYPEPPWVKDRGQPLD